MNKFNNFEEAFTWLKKVSDRTNQATIPAVAQQVYKDSKEFTYLDTEEMYNSGANSDFKNGYVLIKAPQVRKLYYIKCNPRRNKNARIMWFEATKIKNMKNYILQYIEIFKTVKKRLGG